VPPFLGGEPPSPAFVTGDPSGGVPSFQYSFPRTLFARRARVSCTILPLGIEIMALGGLRSADPNMPFFLWSEPLSPLFAIGDPSRGAPSF
jgi:hypothetical protein